MEAREYVLDSIEWLGDTVSLTKVSSGREKYRVDYNIKGYGMGQFNFPRTQQKFDEATDLYIHYYTIVSNKIKLGAK